MSAGMPEYAADLNINDAIYINCYMHVWSNYSNTIVESSDSVFFDIGWKADFLNKLEHSVNRALNSYIAVCLDGSLDR